MTTCGTETPKPFARKVYVYDGALRAVSMTGNFESFWRMSEDNGKSANGSDSRVEVTHVQSLILGNGRSRDRWPLHR
jgi:hypothetical protein